jgi:hypothetical protein
MQKSCNDCFAKSYFLAYRRKVGIPCQHCTQLANAEREFFYDWHRTEGDHLTTFSLYEYRKKLHLGGLCPIIRIADRFDVSESSIILGRNRVMIALPKVISWPTGEKLQSVVIVVPRFQRSLIF